MIPAICPICADFFESTHTVVTCACGHVFHEHCLLQWINTSSTCPQCRRHTTGRSLIRLFFEVQDDDEQLDPTKLKNELNELQAELKQRDKQKSDLAEENAHLDGRVNSLNTNIKKLSKKLNDANTTNEALKKQLSVMSYRMDEAKQARKEAKRLREKLEALQRFEVVMTSNTDTVEDMLREFGDGPKAAKELATYCTSLKREFDNSKDSRKRLKEENSDLRKEANAKSRALELRLRDLEAVQRNAHSLQEEVQSMESERQELKDRIEMLETALRSSHSGNSPSFKHVMFMTPSNTRKKPRLSVPEEGDDIILDPGDPDTPDLSLPSPSIQTKTTCRELGIPFVKTTSLASKKKKAENDLAESIALKNALASSSLFNQRRPLHRQNQGVIRKGYDGMGGYETYVEPVSFQKV